MTATNREIATAAFEAWAAGEGHLSSIFAPDVRWEIVGRSAASRVYGSAEELVAEVQRPLNARFRPDAPFLPVNIRGVYADDVQQTVAVVWDGEGTTLAGTTHRNTFAWFMRFREGKVVEGLVFLDSIAFNELWESVRPAR